MSLSGRVTSRSRKEYDEALAQAEELAFNALPAEERARIRLERSEQLLEVVGTSLTQDERNERFFRYLSEERNVSALRPERNTSEHQRRQGYRERAQKVSKKILDKFRAKIEEPKHHTAGWGLDFRLVGQEKAQKWKGESVMSAQQQEQLAQKRLEKELSKLFPNGGYSVSVKKTNAVGRGEEQGQKRSVQFSIELPKECGIPEFDKLSNSEELSNVEDGLAGWMRTERSDGREPEASFSVIYKFPDSLVRELEKQHSQAPKYDMKPDHEPEL